MCARACAKELLPTDLTKLGVTPGTENRSAQGQLLSVIVPRLLLPTRWYAADARKAGYDLAELKARYPTADWLTLGFRLLDLDEPCVIAVVDDGSVAARADCNRCGGRYRVEGAALTVGPALACTRAACVSPSLGDQFTAALAAVSTYIQREGELELVYAGGSLRFRAAP